MCLKLVIAASSAQDQEDLSVPLSLTPVCVVQCLCTQQPFVSPSVVEVRTVTKPDVYGLSCGQSLTRHDRSLAVQRWILRYVNHPNICDLAGASLSLLVESSCTRIVTHQCTTRPIL